MNINYNLLKVLNALLTEVHVTKAGQRVFLTQAATSNALSQLRNIFADPLLVRGGGGKMRLTPLAQSLKLRVSQALTSIDQVFNSNQSFEPAATERTFHIGMSDYIESILLRELSETFYTAAPSAKLVIKHINYLDDKRVLENADLDIALGNFPKIHNQLNSLSLFEDSTAFFARKNHPIFSKKTIFLKDVLAYPIIIVDYADQPNSNYLEQLFYNSNYNLSANITVPHAHNALEIISKSNYITHSAMRLASPLLEENRADIVKNIRNLPKNLQSSHFQVYQYWHAMMDSNKENLWLRELISSISLKN